MISEAAYSSIFLGQSLSGEYECCPLLATGTITNIYTELNFNGGNKTTSTFAADMLLLVQEYDETGENITDCFQYGGWNVNVEGCGVVNKWPETWNSHTAGYYNATALASRANFSATSWKICIGNGYTTSYSATYKGHLDFSTSLNTTALPPTSQPTGPPSPAPSISPAPTAKPFSSPTAIPSSTHLPTPSPTHVPSHLPTVTAMPTVEPWTITATCGQTMQLAFDTSLAGRQMMCIDFPASGVLDIVNISLFFEGSTTGEWPYDMALIVKYIESSGIQIGGFNYYIPEIDYVGPWPFSWRSSESGLYTATENVTAYEVDGEGYYGICIANAWSYAKTVSYRGQVLLDGLVYRCDISPVPSSQPSYRPTAAPTLSPTALPIISPTHPPTTQPTAEPTSVPTSIPTERIDKKSHDNDDTDDAVMVGITVPIVILVVGIGVFLGVYFYRQQT